MRSHPSPEDTESAEPAGSKAVGAWLVQFARTCKTCRLYDASNPAVIRFREQLYHDLRALLEPFDDIALDVTSRELTHRGVVVYRAPSREDNLAAAFHRDGIRRLTFLKGITAEELGTFVDLFVHVSGHAGAEEDLVTLIWEREISGITVVAAPEEGDVDGGDEGDGGAAPLPWPGAAAAPAGARAVPAPVAPDPDGGSARSDDHNTRDEMGDLEVAYGELESHAIHEMARFQQEYEEESTRPIVARLLERVEDGLATETTPDDRRELASFIPRVLREALLSGDWTGSQSALRMQRA